MRKQRRKLPNRGNFRRKKGQDGVLPPSEGSVAEREALEQALVELVVRALGVIEQTAALGHHHQQATARSVVMLMLSKVLSEVSNALSQQSYLETGGTGILLVNFEVVDVDFAHITTWFCPARQHLQRPAHRAKRGRVYHNQREMQAEFHVSPQKDEKVSQRMENSLTPRPDMLT